MAKDEISNLKARLKSVVDERTHLEELLQKEQAKLRKLDRQADAPEYGAQLAVVNEVKGKIAAIGVDHAELASAVALVSGGKNHRLPVTPGTVTSGA
jgi:chromosome condensin MukBEF ATPase and DNA-binding subunit MukB